MEKPLTFEEASKRLAAKQISWDEYLHHMLVRCTPEWRRPLDRVRGTDQYWWLIKNDPFAYTIFFYQDKLTGVSDSNLLSAVFVAAESGDLEATQRALGCLSDATAGYLVASLALLALRGRRVELLKFTTEWSKKHNTPLDFYPTLAFTEAASDISKEDESEIWQLVSNVHWSVATPFPHELNSVALVFCRASEMFKAKRCTWREYVHQLLNLSVSSKDTTTETPYSGSPLRHDLFAFTLYCYCDKLEEVHDKAMLEAVFIAAEEGKLDEATNLAQRLPQSVVPYIHASLSVMAITLKQPELLQRTLDSSAFRKQFDFEASSTFKSIVENDLYGDVRLEEAIKHSKWREEYPDSPASHRDLTIPRGHPLE